MNVREALDTGRALIWVGMLVQEVDADDDMVSSKKAMALVLPVTIEEKDAFDLFESYWYESLNNPHWDQSKIFITRIDANILDFEYEYE